MSVHEVGAQVQALLRGELTVRAGAGRFIRWHWAMVSSHGAYFGKTGKPRPCCGPASGAGCGAEAAGRRSSGRRAAAPGPARRPPSLPQLSRRRPARRSPPRDDRRGAAPGLEGGRGPPGCQGPGRTGHVEALAGCRCRGRANRRHLPGPGKDRPRCAGGGRWILAWRRCRIVFGDLWLDVGDAGERCVPARLQLGRHQAVDHACSTPRWSESPSLLRRRSRAKSFTATIRPRPSNWMTPALRRSSSPVVVVPSAWASTSACRTRTNCRRCGRMRPIMSIWADDQSLPVEPGSIAVQLAGDLHGRLAAGLEYGDALDVLAKGVEVGE